MEVSHYPNWIVVRLSPAEETLELAKPLWEMLEQQAIFNVVLELDQVYVLRSRMVGELVRLYKQVREMGGVIRLCGLSEANQMVLKMNRLDGRLPHFADRDVAMATDVTS